MNELEQIYNDIARENNAMSLKEVQKLDMTMYLTILMAMNQAKIDGLEAAKSIFDE